MLFRSGSSNAKAFMNAIKYAQIGIDTNLLEEIRNKVSTFVQMEEPAIEENEK